MLDDLTIPVEMKIKSMFRNVWRRSIDFWMTKVMRFKRFTIQMGPSENNTIYQCYGYVCQVNVTITVTP